MNTRAQDLSQGRGGKKIAVVGSGISGLTCAHLLSRQHQLTLFEANDYLGGHTATVDVQYGDHHYAIDTGFIVFNDRTYPNFLLLLDALDVEVQPTEMSFSVHNQATGLEYNGHSLATLFAQKRNLLRPQFWGLLFEILRFNRRCKTLYQQERYPHTHLGDFLKAEGFSDFFAEHYILPMGAAIWSASIADMKGFELQFFIRFFHHHGLLNINDRPQWYVLKGGSCRYIPALVAPFAERVHLQTPVRQIKRNANDIELTTAAGERHMFDAVVLACHSDQALAMLADPSQDEQEILGALPYQDNEVVLHTDIRLLPERRTAWASWNYRLLSDVNRPATVSYNMNILQQLPDHAPTFCVTLNQTQAVDSAKIIRQFRYAHPVFTAESMVAQQQRERINGKNNTYFAGAYWYNGFHEDGVRSALDVCALFGIDLDRPTKPSTMDQE